MKNFSQELRDSLPAPYFDARFVHRRTGIFDDQNVEVYIDTDDSFAVLSPQPAISYEQYAPRQQTLNLTKYKKTFDVISRRFAKISDIFPSSGAVADVGASDGAFLAKLGMERPDLRLVAVEPDNETQLAREALPLAGNYSNLDEAAAAGVQADVVSLFHVFEHIKDPASFIEQLRRILRPGGRIIVEVPSLDDPLLSVYKSKAYESFYFQRQHPFVYSQRSLSRVLTACGLRVLETRPYQRYGLENHLGWLMHGKPGGDTSLAEMFSTIESGYRAAFEAKGLTDTVFAIAEAS